MGRNGWYLAEKIETFICTWVSDDIYNRCAQLAGGESERGNGFDRWRQLLLDYDGGADAVQLGGMRRLQEWTRCNSIGNLNQHLESWIECLEMHNAELLAAPKVLRTMLLGVIPTEYEDDILAKPEIVTYQDIINYCKVRTTYKRQKALSELTRRPGGRINALLDSEKDQAMTPVVDEPPPWAQALITALTGKKASAPPPPTLSADELNALGQAPRGRTTTRQPRGGSDSPARSPSGRRNLNFKLR